jgi:hypothetical protein
MKKGLTEEATPQAHIKSDIIAFLLSYQKNRR